MPPTDFFTVFKNPQDFDFCGLNTAKYFYDLLVTKDALESVNSSNMKNPNPHVFLNKPMLVITGIFQLIRLLLSSRHQTIFFGNDNRITKDGNACYDLYNYQIIQTFGVKKVLVLQDRHDAARGKLFPPGLVIDDLTPFLFLFEKVLALCLRKEVKDFENALAKKIEQIGYSRKIIRVKLIKFYARYLFYDFFLKAIKPNTAILTCHYSKHAFIAACRKLAIPTIELQHGLIHRESKSIYSPNLSKAFIEPFRLHLLPNYLAVYGEYWKEVVTEGKLFPSDAVILIGFYLKTKEIKGKAQKSAKETILFSTQHTVQTQIVEYIKFLSNSLDPETWRIIIKPHPAEIDSAYQNLSIPGFIEVSHKGIDHLLQKADIHIGVYSTVVYEAIRYNVNNYCLYVDTVRAHCDEIIASGVAKRLDQGVLPSLDSKDSNMLNPKYFFDDFHPEVLSGIAEVKNK